jgi:hypothetical protein
MGYALPASVWAPAGGGQTLMDRLHRSLFFSGVERYGSAFFFLVSTAILSRLLKPEEFGVYAAVVALTAVATACFQEFGGPITDSKADIVGTRHQDRLHDNVLHVGPARCRFSLRDVVASFSGRGLRTG